MDFSTLISSYTSPGLVKCYSSGSRTLLMNVWVPSATRSHFKFQVAVYAPRLRLHGPSGPNKKRTAAIVCSSSENSILSCHFRVRKGSAFSTLSVGQRWSICCSIHWRNLSYVCVCTVIVLAIPERARKSLTRLTCHSQRFSIRSCEYTSSYFTIFDHWKILSQGLSHAAWTDNSIWGGVAYIKVRNAEQQPQYDMDRRY